ncbi:ATP-dependent DNA helicase PIF1-like [Senna tora]|uniref:ATP-dependent DNA helicase n=1 Tax=Senna tora TaxID=362788 RepID=A0A834WTT6_9FABA|nr:ATP-dependent DNA helicase PIF1-like [Senna tora]
MRRGLLENDDSIRQCLQEASTFCSPVALRRLFVTILLYCQPTALMDDSEGNNDVPKCIEDELSIPVSDADMQLIDLLNDDQNNAFKLIIDAIEHGRNATFFCVDGPRGQRKTFLYRVVLSSIRKIGMIALATASSSIAATILMGGRTAHSLFKIPLSVDAVDKSTEHNCHMIFL